MRALSRTGPDFVAAHQFELAGDTSRRYPFPWASERPTDHVRAAVLDLLTQWCQWSSTPRLSRGRHWGAGRGVMDCPLCLLPPSWTWVPLFCPGVPLLWSSSPLCLHALTHERGRKLERWWSELKLWKLGLPLCWSALTSSKAHGHSSQPKI